MKLIFLGTGSAFTVGVNNFHSNMLLENNGKRFLIDCGSDIRHSLYEQGYTHRDINAVFISHLHFDHVGGLEWLALRTRFDPKANKPELFVADTLVKDVWQKVLVGGLSSLPEKTPTLQTYFKVHVVKPNQIFHWQKHSFYLIKTLHAMNGPKPMPSYAIKFKANNLNILLTGDLQFQPKTMMPHYLDADIIFHDCETSTKASTVHPPYQNLLELPFVIRKKMWLYDYNDGKLPAAKKQGFRGFVKKGQCFNFNNLKSL